MTVLVTGATGNIGRSIARGTAGHARPRACWRAGRGTHRQSGHDDGPAGRTERRTVPL